jgi:hypothetical protein
LKLTKMWKLNVNCNQNTYISKKVLIILSGPFLLPICHSEHSEESINFAFAARQILRYAQNDSFFKVAFIVLPNQQTQLHLKTIALRRL